MKTKKPGSNVRSLEVLAAIIGRRAKVNVKFVNIQTAATDGKTIYLPRLSAVATEEGAKLVEGLLDHEIMHCRYTDFDFLHSTPVQAEFKKAPLLHTLHNILEDVWGEREQSVDYPGCFRHIKQSMQVMIDRGLYGGQAKADPRPGESLRGFLLHALLARHYGDARLEAFGEIHRGNLVKAVGEKLTRAIWSMALGVDGVKDTRAALELAKRLLALIQHDSEKPKEQKPQPQQAPQQQPQPEPLEQQSDPSSQKQGEGDSGESNDAGQDGDDAQRDGSQGTDGGDEDEGDDQAQGDSGESNDAGQDGDDVQRDGSQGADGGDEDDGDNQAQGDSGESNDAGQDGGYDTQQSQQSQLLAAVKKRVYSVVGDALFGGVARAFRRRRRSLMAASRTPAWSRPLTVR